ncbi:MAG: class I SAM-dependent methyltransferase [Myxococcales bacterium]|nr:class I SAM-dependent methyltransferase [Myxococcales bacterium]
MHRERGSDAHYEDATYYASAYAARTEDLDYYLGLARTADVPMLEYGCGNGRIALPLAYAGHDVTGIDRSRPMLADLRRQLRLAPKEVRARVALRHGDMRSARLGRKFGLVVCTFNTFLHLYTRADVERFLARVLCHLAPRGRFVFDVSVPSAEELARKPERTFRVTPFRHAGTGEVVRYGERFDYDPMTQVLDVAMVFEPRDAPRRRWVTPLCHRQFFPQELEALLHYNGLSVVDLHADFEAKPPARDTTTLIYHAKAR